MTEGIQRFFHAIQPRRHFARMQFQRSILMAFAEEAQGGPGSGLAGDRLYFVSQKGVTIIAQTGAAYKELTRCELGEAMIASPAFADGRIYLRGKHHLFGVGK